jgi:hypothetical protein
MPKAIWRGANGQTYEFQLDPIGSAYGLIRAIFVFCKADKTSGWFPIFVGTTEDLAGTLTPEFQNDPAWKCISAARPTHVGTLRWTGSPSDLRLAADDLIAGIQPPCN